MACVKASVCAHARDGHFVLLQSVAVRCIVLQCVAMRCSALQCVAVCCSALRCAAVRCSVLQCVARDGRFSLIRPLVPTHALLHLPCAFCVAASSCRYKGMSSVRVACHGCLSSALLCPRRFLVASRHVLPASLLLCTPLSTVSATHCNTLQHTATHCKHTASHCIALQHTTQYRTASCL